MLYSLLEERRPDAFEVLAEVPLGKEPQRIDYLLLRRKADADVSDARVLQGLWPKIRKDAIVEYKSIKREVKKGDLAKLLGYGCQYAAQEREQGRLKPVSYTHLRAHET